MKDWQGNHPKIEKPKNADGYLESMARAVFAAGLAWGVVEKKWPTTQIAFDNFSVSKVASYDQTDIDRLMADTGIVRNYKKVVALIDNARSIEVTEKEFGSMAGYIEKTKIEGEEAIVKDLGKRFKFLGPSTAVMFLYGCGEKTA